MSVYRVLAYMALAYYIVLYSVHLVHLAAAYRSALRWKKLGYSEEAHRLSRSGMVPPLTLVADIDSTGERPAQWVDRVLSQRFPEMEVLVIFRQAGDVRARELIDTYFLRRVDRAQRRLLEAPEAREIYQGDDRRLVLVRTDGGEGGDSLNLALNLARFPVFAVAGRAVRLEDDALLCMVRPFMEGEVAAPAVMGVELSLDMEEGLLPPRRITRFALMESLRIQIGFLAGAPCLGGPATAYGALTLYRKSDLLEAGGFKAVPSRVEAQMAMILRLQRLMLEQGRLHRFAFVPALTARRAFPRSLEGCFDDFRERQAGIALALKSETGMLFQARYGILGMLQLPSYWLFVKMAPLFGLAAFALTLLFFAFGLVGWPVLVAYFAVSMLYPALVGAGAVAVARREMGMLKGQGAAMYGYAFLTQFWYRQLIALNALLAAPRVSKGS